MKKGFHEKTLSPNKKNEMLQKMLRLTFCKKNRDWSNFVYTDEARIYFNSDEVSK